jgi:hypothetical protein
MASEPAYNKIDISKEDHLHKKDQGFRGSRVRVIAYMVQERTFEANTAVKFACRGIVLLNF